MANLDLFKSIQRQPTHYDHYNLLFNCLFLQPRDDLNLIIIIIFIAHPSVSSICTSMYLINARKAVNSISLRVQQLQPHGSLSSVVVVAACLVICWIAGTGQLKLIDGFVYEYVSTYRYVYGRQPESASIR